MPTNRLQLRKIHQQRWIGAVSEQEYESATKLAGERTVLICFHVEGEMKILLDILYNVLIFFLPLCLFDVFTCFAEQLLEMLKAEKNCINHSSLEKLQPLLFVLQRRASCCTFCICCTHLWRCNALFGTGVHISEDSLWLIFYAEAFYPNLCLPAVCIKKAESMVPQFFG